MNERALLTCWISGSDETPTEAPNWSPKARVIDKPGLSVWGSHTLLGPTAMPSKVYGFILPCRPKYVLKIIPTAEEDRTFV